MTVRLSRRALLAAAGGAAMPVAAAGALTATGVTLALVAGSPTRARVVEGATMGTRYRVTVPSHGGGPALGTLAAATAEVLARVDAAMSAYRDDSDLARVHAASAGVWVPVAAETAYVVALALDVAAESGGAFDPTVGALVNLWGFGPTRAGPRPPDAEEVRRARAVTGAASLDVKTTPPSIRKAQRGVRLDLGGVAKGYALDAMATRLLDLGATDYLIDVGGELLARGERAPGEAWRVGLERPALRPEREADAPSRVLRVLSLRDAGVATSGDSRRGVWAEGRWWSHLLDPREGAPVGPALASVTVRATCVARADAWSTALMALGPRRGLDVARQRAMAALFVVRDGERFEVTTVGGLADGGTSA